MARYRCRTCAQEGTFVYDGRLECPHCGSADVQFAIGTLELPDDDPELKRLAEQDGEKNHD
jgi:hypothetical protein